MIGAGFPEQIGDRGAAARHLGVGKMRVLGFVNSAKMRWQWEILRGFGALSSSQFRGLGFANPFC